MLQSRWFACLALMLLVFGMTALIMLPADIFDKGPSLCLSVLLLDQTCYGCGMTRALQHLIHLDFAGAAAFNKLSFVVLPLLLYLWVHYLVVFWMRFRRTNRTGDRHMPKT